MWPGSPASAVRLLNVRRAAPHVQLKEDAQPVQMATTLLGLNAACAQPRGPTARPAPVLDAFLATSDSQSKMETAMPAPTSA